MKSSIIAILILFPLLEANAQAPALSHNPYADVDRKAMDIPAEKTKSAGALALHIKSEFADEADRLRAAFFWVAANIEYDVAKMNKPEPIERDINISNTLVTHKAICSGYSALFSELCAVLGMKCYEIHGYTMHNGVRSAIAHAWCAVQVGGEWFLFDPTWAAGFIHNGRFVRRLNNVWFMAAPSEFIKSHMPFDYLWQFLYYPATYTEFLERKSVLQNGGRPYFNYPDSLRLYDSQGIIEQLTASVRRTGSNDLTNLLVQEELEIVNHNILSARAARAVDFYNSGIEDFNAAAVRMNVFISYWNSRFKPTKSDREIQAMLDDVRLNLDAARDKLAEVKKVEGYPEMEINKFESEIEALSEMLRIYQEWFGKYLVKGKIGREAMFYKLF